MRWDQALGEQLHSQVCVITNKRTNTHIDGKIDHADYTVTVIITTTTYGWDQALGEQLGRRHGKYTITVIITTTIYG